MLIASLPNDPIRPLLNDHAPDAEDWHRYLDPYRGKNWLEIPWFLAETYFYRRIAEAVDFFGTGTDPFALQKRRGVEVAWDDIHALAQTIDNDGEGWSTTVLVDRVLTSLWGNQADLSLWPAGEEGQPQHAEPDAQRAHLLADDTEAFAAWLNTHRPLRRLDVIADNAGFELVADLALIDYLLTSGAAEAIHLHLKLHPTFVSDALPYDVEATIDALATSDHMATSRWGERLRDVHTAGRLRYRQDAYWNSPLAGWEMPDALRQDLAGADLCISKGDANYRRWHGDRKWPFTAPFTQVVSYFPAPLLALRTVKAELISGLPEGRALEVNRQDPDWMTNGQWGVVQFKR